MHFVIFVPEGDKRGAFAPTVSPADTLRSVGLDNLADDKPFVRAGRVKLGESEVSGKVFGWQTNGGALSLDTNPDETEWLPACATEELPHSRYWVGINRKSPPKPMELERAKPLRCLSVVLGDGNPWWFVAERALPRDLIINLHGQAELHPQRKYVELCELTDHWRELVQRVNPSYTVGEVLDYVRLSININYRLTVEVQNYLRLWSFCPGEESEEAIGTVHQAFHQMLRRAGVLRGEHE